MAKKKINAALLKSATAEVAIQKEYQERIKELSNFENDSVVEVDRLLSIPKPMRIAGNFQVGFNYLDENGNPTAPREEFLSPDLFQNSIGAATCQWPAEPSGYIGDNEIPAFVAKVKFGRLTDEAYKRKQDEARDPKRVPRVVVISVKFQEPTVPLTNYRMFCGTNGELIEHYHPTYREQARQMRRSAPQGRVQQGGFGGQFGGQFGSNQFGGIPQAPAVPQVEQQQVEFGTLDFTQA